MTAPELAEELGITGRKLRDWLRAEYSRAAAEHQQRWIVDGAMAEAARRHFRGS